MHDYELYGYSLFETFLAKKGTFWRLDAHWERLSASASFFGMDAPDKERFFKDVIARHDATRIELLRYTLLQGGGRWSDAPSRSECRILKQAYEPQNVGEMRLRVEQRALPVRDESRNHKTGSRMSYQASYNRARNCGFDDCIFVDTEGYLLESSTANLVLKLDGDWITPQTSRGILPGVMRRHLLEGDFIQERDLRASDISEVEAAFCANAVRGIVPISALGSRMLSTASVKEFKDLIGDRDYVSLS